MGGSSAGDRREDRAIQWKIGVKRSGVVLISLLDSPSVPLLIQETVGIWLGTCGQKNPYWLSRTWHRNWCGQQVMIVFCTIIVYSSRCLSDLSLVDSWFCGGKPLRVLLITSGISYLVFSNLIYPMKTGKRQDRGQFRARASQVFKTSICEPVQNDTKAAGVSHQNKKKKKWDCFFSSPWTFCLWFHPKNPPFLSPDVCFHRWPWTQIEKSSQEKLRNRKPWFPRVPPASPPPLF